MTNPDVREGRNPAWRVAWERLPKSERRSIARAARRGGPPAAPLPLARGYARRAMRNLRWQMFLVIPLQLVVTGLQVSFGCDGGGDLRCSFWRVLTVVWLVLIVFVVHEHGRMKAFVRACDAQTEEAPGHVTRGPRNGAGT